MPKKTNTPQEQMLLLTELVAIQTDQIRGLGLIMLPHVITALKDHVAKHNQEIDITKDLYSQVFRGGDLDNWIQNEFVCNK